MAAKTPIDVVAARQTLKIVRQLFRERSDAASQEMLQTLRSMCPALSLPEVYRPHQDAYGWGQALHLTTVIRNNDLAALYELIQVDPSLLTHQDPFTCLRPPLVEAVKQGRLDVIRILLQHRATLLLEQPELLIPPYNCEYENYGGPFPWGTPLTTACSMGRIDIVHILLEGMPDVGIDEVDNFGHTAFLSAAGGQHDSHNSQGRLEILRLLMSLGSDVHAVRVESLHRDETLEYESDKDTVYSEGDVFVSRPLPGGLGNALVLAMDAPATAAPILEFLVEEAGVNVFQSCLADVRRVDFTRGLPALMETGKYKINISMTVFTSRP